MSGQVFASTANVTGRPSDRTGWWTALLAAAIALTLRLIYVYGIRHLPLFDSPVMDAEIHDAWARGRMDLIYKGIAYFRAPLYPWFLQAVYALNDAYMAPRVVQAVLSALSVGLAADLGRRLASAWAGLIGGLLLALCWPDIYFAGELLLETFAVTLGMAALWMLVVVGERVEQGRHPVRLALGAALMLGLASIARPTVLAFLPVLALLPLRVWPQLRAGAGHPAPAAGQRLRMALLLSLVALAPGLAVTVRNGVVGGDWAFIATQGGVNFYIGNNPQSDGRTAVVPGTRSSWLGGYEDTRAMAQTAVGRPLKPSEVSSWFTRQGLRFWVQQPGAALKLYARKLRLLVGAGERGNNLNLQFWRAQSPLLRLPVFVSWATLFALGLAGIVLCRRKVVALPLWGFLAATAVVVLLFFVNERFRLPMTVAFASFAGIPVVAAVQAARGRRSRALAGIFALVAVPFALSQLDRLDFNENRLDADAYSRNTMGNAWLRKGRPDIAMSWYVDALEVGRKFQLTGTWREVEPMVRRSLAEAYVKLGRLRDAEDQLRSAQALAPGDPQTALAWGEFLSNQERWPEAIPYYRQVLERYPDTLPALVGLGWAQVRNSAHLAAVQTFRRALAIDPKHAQAHAGLGVALYDGPRNRAAARAELEAALALDPDVALAHQYMADIYNERYKSERRPEDFQQMVWHLREVMRVEPENLQVKRFFNRSGISTAHGDTSFLKQFPLEAVGGSPTP